MTVRHKMSAKADRELESRSVVVRSKGEEGEGEAPTTEGCQTTVSSFDGPHISMDALISQNSQNCVQ